MLLCELIYDSCDFNVFELISLSCDIFTTQKIRFKSTLNCLIVILIDIFTATEWCSFFFFWSKFISTGRKLRMNWWFQLCWYWYQIFKGQLDSEDVSKITDDFLTLPCWRLITDKFVAGFRLPLYTENLSFILSCTACALFVYLSFPFVLPDFAFCYEFLYRKL